MTFWLAATPGAPDNVLLTVVWGNIDSHGETISEHQHDFTFVPFGHSGTNMGWTKHTFIETADPADFEARIYFISTTNFGPSFEDYGPVIDAASVEPT